MEAVKALEVVAPGPMSTVQDLGRLGAGRYGVPRSGAVDCFSLRAANLLVENEEGEAGIEVTLMGLKVRVLECVTIAVTGGDLQPSLNGHPFPMWRSHEVEKGDELSFQGPKTGCRAYLAVSGGIDVPWVLGSRSTNLRASFGGLEGRPLRQGDVLLACCDGKFRSAKDRVFPETAVPSFLSRIRVRTVPGPQADHFPQEALDRFHDADFEVTPRSDRTGIRLAGPSIQRKPGLAGSIISEGVVPGAVQVPGDGNPILILGETVTGGYRKIATVISTDVPLLGQARPGHRIRFQAVTLEEAHKAFLEAEAVFKGLRFGGSAGL